MNVSPGTVCGGCGYDPRHGHWYCQRCDRYTAWNPVPWEPRLAIVECSECHAIIDREPQSEWVTILRPEVGGA